MNLLGHNYVSQKVLGRISPQICAGALLPDMVPFISDSVLEFTEIHDPKDRFLNFVKERHPENLELALSMMCHGYDYGADFYNKEVVFWLLGDGKTSDDIENGELFKKIANNICEVSGIEYNVAAELRMHNYLWCGVEFFLIKNEKSFVNETIDNYKKINISELSDILHEYSQKNVERLERNISSLVNPILENNLAKEEGYVKYWKEFLSQLSEGDNFDTKPGLEFFNFLYFEFETLWQQVINMVVDGVQKRMKPFMPNL